MVSKDKKIQFVASQVVVLSLNNSQKFLIVGFVVSLSKDLLLREKSYKVPLTNFK